MTENSGIGIDGFELRFDTDPSETGHHWEIWQDGEFVVSGRTGAEAIGALASVANSEGWYTDSDGNPWPLMSEKVTQEPITDITTLEKGDGVLFEGLSSPLIVVSTATSASDEVQLQGPEGGEYRAECRPRLPRPITIYPGHGCVDDPVRVVLEQSSEDDTRA